MALETENIAPNSRSGCASAPAVPSRPIRRILIANRGEIACRVIKSARRLGIEAVAVYSDADRDARHVRMADRAVRIGPPPVSQSYLSIDNVLAAAKSCSVDAIHPGYGFLSENAAFADACAEAGIVFIGPSATAIRSMGDKAAAKRRMEAANVPCVPGYHGADQSDEKLTAEAERIGYPVMVKAAAGGGGRGMRLVDAAAALPAALRGARSEAKNAFGDETLLIERAIIQPRHVEIQVFGDKYGNVIHLGERDCSVQRRHQKVIEESPSPAVDAELRAAMGAAAVRAAKSIDYVGAGTIELLLGADRNFYFLEMNTRLQVEHPVTEMVTGLDLVELQIQIAQGKPLPVGQEDVRLDGSAIEVRLYAEDAARGFLPQVGPIHLFEPPSGIHVRTDHGLRQQGVVTPYYDAMLAKIVAWGEDRNEAITRLTRAVSQTRLLGVTTNREFLVQALSNPQFAAGRATTAFIGDHFPNGMTVTDEGLDEACAAAVLLFAGDPSSSWSTTAPMPRRLLLRQKKNEHMLDLTPVDDGWAVSRDGQSMVVSMAEDDGRRMRAMIGGRVFKTTYALRGNKLFLQIGARDWAFEDVTFEVRAADPSLGDGLVRTPLSGIVRTVNVDAGRKVGKGELLATIEAMKMEHNIVAPAGGTVEAVLVRQGAQVAMREVLIKFIADVTP